MCESWSWTSLLVVQLTCFLIRRIRKYQTFPVPGSELTPSELASAVHREEMNVLQTSQHLSGGIVTLPGVKDLLSKLRKGGARWGIVTNATRVYATKMLEIAGVGEMPFLISGEDVKRGKPSPDPYLAGIEGECTCRFSSL